MKDYTPDELITLCATSPNPEIRRIAARMLYTMGMRDQSSQNLRELTKGAELVPA